MIDESGYLKIADFKRLIQEIRAPQNAAIYADSVGANAEVRSITIDLTTARLRTAPLEIGFPFRSFIVYDATDGDTTANLVLSTRDSYQDPIPLRKAAGLKLPFAVNKATMYWSAQSSKTLTILFFLTGEYETNLINLAQSGGVSITDGTSVADPVLNTVTTTAAILFASSSTRKKAMIMNYGGTSIFIGGGTTLTDDTGATPGIEVQPGGSYAWESSAACYAISKGGSNTNISVIAFS